MIGNNDSTKSTIEQFIHSNREENDSGFGDQFTSADVRLMNRDGSLNVTMKGVNSWRKFNLYKELIKLNSFYFYLSFLVLYILLNAVFASIYLTLGTDGLNTDSNHFNWWDAFFFSTQTFTTLGYGHISPNSFVSNVLASTEAFVGLLYFAIATGLVYGRFSTSQANLLFSKNALISPMNENKYLIFRLANVSVTELSDLTADIIMSWIEKDEFNVPIRRYRKLPLELDHISLLTTSWTIIHKITDESPCEIMNDKQSYKGLEFMVFITAFDEIFEQTVKMRTSYIEKDLVKNAKFVQITSYNGNRASVDLDKLSDYVYFE